MLRGPILKSYFFPNYLCSDVRFNYMRFAHISHTKHQAGNTVAMADYRITGKQQCLSALLRPWQFGEYDANHEGLNEDAHNTLQTHGENGFWTLFRDKAIAVADGVLGFYGIEEGRGEATHFRHAHCVGKILGVQQLGVALANPFQITMCIRYCPPDETKEGPGDHKTQGKDQECPTPLCVYQSGENILKRSTKIFIIKIYSILFIIIFQPLSH